MSYQSHRPYEACCIIIGFFVAFLFLQIFDLSKWQFISLVFGSAVVVYFLGLVLFQNLLYLNGSTKQLPKELVVNSNTIKNRSCTVIFTPGQKIVVMDNHYDINNNKRMFTLSKNDLNINRAWYKMCGLFDENSTVDSLSMFFNIDVKVKIIVFDTRKVKPAKPVVETPQNVSMKSKVEKVVINKTEGIEKSSDNKIPETMEKLDNIENLSNNSKDADDGRIVDL